MVTVVSNSRLHCFHHSLISYSALNYKLPKWLGLSQGNFWDVFNMVLLALLKAQGMIWCVGDVSIFSDASLRIHSLLMSSESQWQCVMCILTSLTSFCS